MNEMKATFTRPNDTVAYSVGDIVANDTLAANVVPLKFSSPMEIIGIERARLITSSTSVTNGQFRLHLYLTDPTLNSGIANGDNGAFSTKNAANYLGAIDITVDVAFVDGAVGVGVPRTGSATEININFGAIAPSAQTIYGILEARGAYTPTANGTFTVFLEPGVQTQGRN